MGAHHSLNGQGKGLFLSGTGDSGYLITAIGHRFFQGLPVHRGGQGDGGGPLLPVGGGGHPFQGVEGLFHPALAVGAHHPLNGQDKGLGGLFRFLLLLSKGTGSGGAGFFLLLLDQEGAFQPGGLSQRLIVGGVIHLDQIQPEGVGDHTEAGQAHGCGSHHGVEDQPQPCIAAGGQRNTDRIVEEGPEQVLVDGPDDPTGEPDGCGGIQQVAFYQDQVGGVHGNMGACSNGSAHIGPGKGGGIIDAVPHHHDPTAFLLKAADLGFLLLGQHLGHHLVYPHLVSHSPGGGGMVPGKEDHLAAQSFQLGNGLGAGRLGNVRHPNDTHQFPAHGKVHGGLALGSHLLAGFFHLRGDGAVFLYIVQVSPVDRAVQEHSPYPPPRHRLDLFHGSDPKFHLLGLFQNGLGQGVFAPRFQAGSQVDQELFGDFLLGGEADHPGLALGNGAGFIQHHRIAPTGDFQGGGGFEKDPAFGSHAAAHHHRHRGGQAQGAGAADDQHADGPGKGIAEALPQSQPDGQGN